MFTIKKLLLLFTFSLALILLIQSCDSEEPTKSFSLSTIVSPPNSGEIEAPSSPIRQGESIVITAIPEPNWVFSHWEGDAMGNLNPLNLTMTADKTLTGVFVKREYPLSLTIDGEGTVEEKLIVNPSGREYPHGSTVELTPKPNAGWVFSGWSGDASGNNSPLRINVEKAMNITATFVMQSPVALFGGSEDDILSKIIATTQGKYLLVGTTASNDGIFEGLNKGGQDAFVIQLDADLTLDWVKVFGGSGDDSASSIIQNSDGSYSLTGSFKSTNGDFAGLLRGTTDAFHIKLDQNGNATWIKTFGNARTNIISKSLIQDQDGVFILLATADGDCCNGFQGGNGHMIGKDMVLIFISPTGDLLQIRNYGAFQDEEASVLYKKRDGNLILLGTQQQVGQEGKENLLVIATDRFGSQYSSAVYSGSGRDIGFDVIESGTCCFLIVVGTTTSTDGDFSNYGFGKANIFMKQLAYSGLGVGGMRTFGGSENDHGTSLFRFPNSNDLYVLGSSDSQDFDLAGQTIGGSDLVLIKTDSYMNKNWLKTFGGTGNEGFFANPQVGHLQSQSLVSMTNSQEGGLILAGSTESNDLLFEGLNQGKKDILVIKTDAAGNIN